jgi:hypothetical protein
MNVVNPLARSPATEESLFAHVEMDDLPGVVAHVMSSFSASPCHRSLSIEYRP